MLLSTGDIDALKALQGDRPPALNSTHRLRLEMLGLVRDTAQGLLLTPLGMAALNAAPKARTEQLPIDVPPLRDPRARHRRAHVWRGE